MSRFQEQRPRFFEGQYLGADDLTATVAYNRLQQARHVLGAHTWGIAMGLQLKETSRPGGRIEVYVMPGYAWDGFGRPVVVLAPYNIPAELFRSYVYDRATDGVAGRLIEVWLRYDELARQQVRPGFEVCETEDQLSRVHETFRLEVGPRPSHLDRHDRIAVAGSVVDAQDAVQQLDPHTPPVALFDESIPYQHFPPEGERAHWLIPLGVVRWLPSSNPNQLGTFVSRTPDDLAKSRSLRRYIGVVAESLQAADGILRLRDRTRDYSQVQSNDLVWVEGSLRVEGDVRPFGGKIDFRHADGRDYGVPLTIQRTGDPGPGPRALQVSLGPGPDPQTNNRFSVGALKDGNTLDEKFVVLSNGSVGIGTTKPSGRLTIHGTIQPQQGELTFFPQDADIAYDGGSDGLFIFNNTHTGGGKTAFTGGDIGIGLYEPVCRLHVADNINANANNVDAHVAVIENTNDGLDASVLALKIPLKSPPIVTVGNNFVTFFNGTVPVGHIELQLNASGTNGVAYLSGGADFAECLPRLQADEAMEEGDIVGVFAGKITKVTQGAHHVTVITSRPVVVGNAPSRDSGHLYSKVSFLGQVYVKVRGTVHAGDYIVPSGLNDGTGIAVSPQVLSAVQSMQAVGKAWESADGEGLNLINVAVGLSSSVPGEALLSLIRAQQKEITTLKGELRRLTDALHQSHYTTG